MILYPAIDVFQGQAVRLTRGDYAQMTVYARDAADIARKFKASGAEWAHVVDLEGAKSGDTPNFEKIREIISIGLKIEVGGGIRSREVAETYLDAGAARVILGTAAASDPELLGDLLSDFGERIAVGLDIKDGRVATHGWTRLTQERFESAVERLIAMGVKTLICTDISKDGMLAGTNIDMYKKIAGGVDVIASGGVSTLNDIISLKKIGVGGAILGRAYYENRVTIDAALAACGGE